MLGIDVVAHPDQVRARIGLAGQVAAIDGNLTGRENLRVGVTCGPPWASWWPTERRCSSPRSTSRRPTCWPRGPFARGRGGGFRCRGAGAGQRGGARALARRRLPHPDGRPRDGGSDMTLALREILAMTWRNLLTILRLSQLLVFATIQPLLFVLMLAVGIAVGFRVRCARSCWADRGSETSAPAWPGRRAASWSSSPSRSAATGVAGRSDPGRCHPSPGRRGWGGPWMRGG